MERIAWWSSFVLLMIFNYVHDSKGAILWKSTNADVIPYCINVHGIQKIMDLYCKDWSFVVNNCQNKIADDSVHDSFRFFQFDRKETIASILLQDYDQLNRNSNGIKKYSIKQKAFEDLFWEGAAGALSFYLSKERVSNETVTNLINSGLQMNPSLVHSFDKIAPTEIKTEGALKILERFTGYWYGMWEEMEVHHLWLPVRTCEKSISNDYTLVGFQSCFTGDGIGWNYIVSGKNEMVILGLVYHYDIGGILSAKNPHYAFLNANNSITWISDSHMYLETMCDKSTCINEEHYVITGGRYEKDMEELSFKEKFQAVYLRKDKSLPHFLKVP